MSFENNELIFDGATPKREKTDVEGNLDPLESNDLASSQYGKFSSNFDESEINYGSAKASQATLGQLAEQVQANARAKAASRGSALDIDHYSSEEDVNSSMCTPGKEHIGRWTKQEHELFLEALKKYGKEWKKVAQMVKTRTVVQTRTHAQKFFQKLSKFGSGGSLLGIDIDSFDLSSLTPGMLDPNGKKSEEFLSMPSSSIQSAKRPRRSVEGRVDLSLISAGNFEEVFDDIASSVAPLSVPLPPPMMSLPQPSPAACGKRKHAELAVAEALAASAAHDNDNLNSSSQSMISTPISNRKSLRLRTVSSSVEGPEEPSTPWEADMKALRASRASRLGQCNSGERFEAFKMEDEISFTKNDRMASSSPIDSSSMEDKVSSFSPSLFFDHSSWNVSKLRLLFESLVVSGNDSLLSSNLLLLKQFIQSPNYQLNSPGESAMTFDNLIQQLIDDNNRSLLMLACNANPLEVDVNKMLLVCQVLLENGFHVNSHDCNGSTPLHFASFRGLDKIAKILLAKGAPINACDNCGNTALHLACRFEKISMIELLTSYGANPHIFNHNSKCALDLLASPWNYSANCPYGAGVVFENKFAQSTPVAIQDVPMESLITRAKLRRSLFALEPRLRTLVLFHQDCLLHSTRSPAEWEGPPRLQEIINQLQTSDEIENGSIEVSSHFDKASVDLLAKVHSVEYLQMVDSLAKQLIESHSSVDMISASPLFPSTGNDGDNSIKLVVNKDGYVSTDPIVPRSVPFTPQVQRYLWHKDDESLKKAENCDTSFSSGTLQAARRAAGAVAHAVDCVLLGRNRNAFCVVRPPGHHAGYNGLLDGAKSCGFCIFNNVAVGALHALEVHKCEKVAIIDLDIHHGNGTEDIVRRYPNPSRLLFFSLHLFDHDDSGYEFFPGSGLDDDMIHNIINVPIVPMWNEPSVSHSTRQSSFARGSKSICGRDVFRQVISQRLLPSLRAFNPNLILISMGFDAAMGDVGNQKYSARNGVEIGMNLLDEDFEWATSEIMKIGDICCSGRIVSVLEGGYGSRMPNKAPLKHGSPNSTIDRTASLQRTLLGTSTMSHLHRLVDPYGPSSSVLKGQKEKEASDTD